MSFYDILVRQKAALVLWRFEIHNTSSVLWLSLEYSLVTKELRRLGQGIRVIELIVNANPDNMCSCTEHRL